MMELLTGAQMRALEMAAIASGEVTGLELMERAGAGVVAAIFEEWPTLAGTSDVEQGTARSTLSSDLGRTMTSPPKFAEPKEGYRAVVLCGPGNNGGDGFVVARLLARRGWSVEVFLYGDADKLPPDARVNYEQWCEMGAVRPLSDDAIDGYTDNHPDTRIVIDALFGSGLSRPFRDLGRVQDELNCYCSASVHGDAPHVVSIDVPSGLSSDTGRFVGCENNRENPVDQCILANLTVTFHSPFVGHYLAEGALACGRLVVTSIGLEKFDAQYDPARRRVSVVPCARAGFLSHERRLGKTTGRHKFAHGHALILSGGSGRTGAARLAARGALRIGAGLVTLGVPPAAHMEVANHATAVMLQRVRDAGALIDVLADTRINALCLGPGMGTGARETALVREALSSGRACVMDADALTLIARDKALFAALHDECVLTPHAGEFQRLFPDISEKLSAKTQKGAAYSKADAARDAAARAGCVLLFKGADTVIAHPGGRCSIHAAVYERAAPWLATAGSGDVLAGFITGLLARGFAPMLAAETAAYLHVECARAFGPGLIAEDLPEVLPQVLRDLQV